MKIKGKVNQYVNKNGNIVFVYSLECDAKELKAYKDVQGVNYKEHEETKLPLYWTMRPVNVGDTLHKTTKGNFQVYADLEEQTKRFTSKVEDHSAKFEAIKQWGGFSKHEIAMMMMKAQNNNGAY